MDAESGVMKFQIGDLVILKHTGSEGKITGIENGEMFLVTIDGVEIPVFEENIDHPYFDWFTSDKAKKKNLRHITADQVPVESNRPGTNHPQGYFLSFFPVFNNKDPELIDKFRIYFINQERYQVRFRYTCSLSGKKLFSIKGDTLPFTNFYIHDITMEEMYLNPLFQVGQADRGGEETSNDIRIRPKKLFQFLTELREGESPSFSLPLKMDPIPDRLKIEEWDMQPVKVQLAADTHGQRLVKEIDLHIEKLVDGHQSLSNAEIIKIQLDAFIQVLEEAIARGQDDLTVIHGVGKGKLKEEIHSILRSTPEVRHFLSDWSPKYGNGATQIFFNN